MKNVIIGAIVGAIVGAGVSGAIVSTNANNSAMKPAAAAQTPAKAPEKQKTVYHINYKGGENDSAYMAALRNVNNHISAVGADKVDIKVVLHANGLDVLKNATSNEALRGQIQGLKAQHVAFQVCENTMVRNKIEMKDLYDASKEDIVASGVAELARLQHLGYAYIKP